MRSSNSPLSILILTTFGLMAGGCSYRVSKDSGSFAGLVISREQLESISYQEVKNKVFVPKCISCHGNSGGVNLENYSNARSHLDHIKTTALVSRSMPKSGSEMLTSEEYLLLAAWVKAGGPETPLNGGDIPPPPPVEVLKPEFASIKKLIIDRKCLSCHASDGKAPRVLLNTPDDMINSPLEIVIPGNAEESDLILTLERETAIKPMPPMDSGITPVSKEDIEVVKEWIQKGAKD
jgi:uncharacterized membrane protein